MIDTPYQLPATREALVAEWRAKAAQRERKLPMRLATPRPTGTVAVLSLGNSDEAHGPALPRDIDDRLGAAVAVRVCERTGARYVGHLPYSTDRLGGLAAVWSPKTLPYAQFYARIVADLRRIIDAQPELSALVLISGHGGNGAIAPDLAALSRELGGRPVRYELALRMPPALQADGRWSLAHASGLEHSVAAALGAGCFDRTAFEALNARLASDFVGTLQAYPAVAGLAGYYLFGGDEFEPMRARYVGIKPEVAQVLQTRRLECDPSVGHAVLEHTVAMLMEVVEEAGVARAHAG